MGEVQSKLQLTESYIRVNDKSSDDGLKTISDCLKHFSSSRFNRNAVVFAATDGTREAVTWKELYEKSCNVARHLIKMGVKRGEIVGINLRTCPEWLYVAFGSLLAGAIAFGVSFTYKDGSDLIAMMDRLKKCAVLVMDPGADGENWEVVRMFVDDLRPDGRLKSKKMSSVRYLILHKAGNFVNRKHRSVDDLVIDEFLDVAIPDDCSENDIAFLFQTSGSTGVPKVVAHTHKSILTMRVFESDLTNSRDDIAFNDRPFAWLGGFPHGVLFGQTRVTVSGFCPPPSDRVSFLIDIIQKENCSVVQMLPQMILQLMNKKERSEKLKLKSIFTGGQPLMRHFSECTGTICRYFVNIYGGAEFAGVSVSAVDSNEKFIDYACGKPLRGSKVEIKVVNEKEETVPIGVLGEVYLRGESMFSGYYNDEEKTRKVLTEDCWYKTDDIGMMNIDGVLVVQGRKSSMIICGGMNVAPEILESSMRTCPSIESVVVVPVSHQTLYQVICACVIPKAKHTNLEESIRDFCEKIHNDRPRMFTVLPEYYLFFDKFPETSTGKVSRKSLTVLAEKRFGNLLGEVTAARG